MSDRELEQVEKKKFEDRMKESEAENKLKATLYRILDEQAYNRMMNVKVANPDVYVAAAQGCISVFSRLGRKLSDQQVLLILKSVKGEEKKTKITFERK